MSQGQSSVALEVECSILVFPPERQASRVREVAGRLMRKRSQKSADAECSRVADEMFARLAALGLGEAEQDEARQRGAVGENHAALRADRPGRKRLA